MLPLHAASIATNIVQRARGANLGEFGGQVEDGTTVIVCTECGGRFYEVESGGEKRRLW